MYWLHFRRSDLVGVFSDGNVFMSDISYKHCKSYLGVNKVVTIGQNVLVLDTVT